MSCGADKPVANKGFDYIELTGSKIRLRSTAAGDATRAYELIGDNQNILRWLCWNGPKDEAELAETYGKRWPEEMRRGIKYSFAIEEITKPGIIGCIDARVGKDPQQFEAGYWIGVPYWRKGYTPEALSLLCYLCFHHLEAAVVQSSAFVGNNASRRVMEKNGFTFEGTLRRHIHKGEQWIDLWHLSLLREEWLTQGFSPVYEKLIPHQLVP
jgi:ribosomal-protein-alanine N-acetyltransferase